MFKHKNENYFNEANLDSKKKTLETKNKKTDKTKYSDDISIKNIHLKASHLETEIDKNKNNKIKNNNNYNKTHEILPINNDESQLVDDNDSSNFKFYEIYIFYKIFIFNVFFIICF